MDQSPLPARKEKAQHLPLRYPIRIMKKILLIFSAILSVSFANSQTDASVMLNLSGAMTGVVTSGSDGSFIATLPSGENIVASHILLTTGESVINIKKISWKI